MDSRQTIGQISNSELVCRVQALVRSGNRTTAELVAHLAEFDGRRLYVKAACSSLFVYCTSRLGLSEQAAYKRITAARASRRFPEITALLADGRLHLAGLCVLAPHLTRSNHQELLGAAVGKTARAVKALVAAKFPEPEVPDRVRKLPERRPPPVLALPPGAANAPSPPGWREQPETQLSVQPPAATPNGEVAAAAQASQAGGSVPAPSPATGGGTPPHDPITGEVASNWSASQPGPHPGAPAPLRLAPAQPEQKLDPLSEARFRVQFTADTDLREKIRRAQELLSHAVPNGDLAKIIGRALTLLIQEQERRRFGARRRSPATPGDTSRVPRSDGAKPPTHQQGPPHQQQPTRRAGETSRTGAASRYIPAAVRREVWERDGGQCTYVDPQGRRCGERRFLEFEHRNPHARGGPGTAENLCLLCRAHNQAAARNKFGSQFVDERVTARNRGATDSRRG